mmetsp:Transcript_10604/g.29638  ORF Transcript_10604/g.29638 Transcript_10604/m.29638 type:complete len:597 (+) Transcript_10604:522-2312(+)
MCTHRSGSPLQLRHRRSCHWYLVRSCSFAASAASAEAACALDLHLAVDTAHARSSSSRSFSASTGSTSPEPNQPFVGAMNNPSRGTGRPSLRVTTLVPDAPLRAMAQSAESIADEALARVDSNVSLASATEVNARVSPVPSHASFTTANSARVDPSAPFEPLAPTPVSLCTHRSIPASSATSSAMSESTLPTTSFVRSGAAATAQRRTLTPPPALKLQGNRAAAWRRVPRATSGPSRRKWVMRRCVRRVATASSASGDDDTTSAARRSTRSRGIRRSSVLSLPDPSRSFAHNALSSRRVFVSSSPGSARPRSSTYLSWNSEDWGRATIKVSSTRSCPPPSTSKSATRRSVVIRFKPPPIPLHSCSSASASTNSVPSPSSLELIASIALKTAGKRMESAARSGAPRVLTVSLATTTARPNLTRAWGSDLASTGSAASAASPTASTIMVWNVSLERDEGRTPSSSGFRWWLPPPDFFFFFFLLFFDELASAASAAAAASAASSSAAACAAACASSVLTGSSAAFASAALTSAAFASAAFASAAASTSLSAGTMIRSAPARRIAALAGFLSSAGHVSVTARSRGHHLLTSAVQAAIASG